MMWDNFFKVAFFPGSDSSTLSLITLQRLLCQGYQGSKWDCFDHLSKNLSFFQSPCPAQFAPFCFVLQLLIKWFVKDQHTNCFSFVFVGSFVKGGTAHEEAEILRKQSFFFKYFIMGLGPNRYYMFLNEQYCEHNILYLTFIFSGAKERKIRAFF